jgi:hypothetical protein
MKNCLIIFVLALIVTSWLNDTHTPAKPEPVGISSEMKEKNLGMERKDQNIADFTYIDQSEPKLFLTKIGDKGCCRKLDFPYAAAN